MSNHIKGINPFPLLLFACGRNQDFASKVASHLELTLEPNKYKMFADGDFLLHQANSVRDRNLFVICQPSKGKAKYVDLFECFQMITSLRQASPKSWITVVMPYLNFARQDKPSNRREPILSHLIPQLLQALGANQIVVGKLHNPASRTVYPLIPMEDIDTTPLIIEDIKENFPDLSKGKYKFAAPDVGATKSCREVARYFGIDLVIVDKYRDPKSSSNDNTDVINVIGDPSGYDVIMIDDIADTSGTSAKGSKALKEAGAKDTHIICTHPVLSGNAIENLNGAGFKSVTFTNSCLISKKDKARINNFHEIDITKYVAQTIDNLHNGNSVSSLWNGGNEE